MRRTPYTAGDGGVPERSVGTATSRIVIKPAWVLSSDAGDHFEPQLFRLLRAIHDHGKLTVAARSVGLSYRHAWDLLGKWNGIFGSELVLLARGRGARVGVLGQDRALPVDRHEARLPLAEDAEPPQEAGHAHGEDREEDRDAVLALHPQ